MVHGLYKGDEVGITNTDQHAGCVHPLNSLSALGLNVWHTHGVYKLCSVIRATAAFYESLLRRGSMEYVSRRNARGNVNSPTG